MVPITEQKWAQMTGQFSASVAQAVESISQFIICIPKEHHSLSKAFQCTHNLLNWMRIEPAVQRGNLDLKFSSFLPNPASVIDIANSCKTRLIAPERARKETNKTGRAPRGSKLHNAKSDKQYHVPGAKIHIYARSANKF